VPAAGRSTPRELRAEAARLIEKAKYMEELEKAKNELGKKKK
jgi:hypothetical protein